MWSRHLLRLWELGSNGGSHPEIILSWRDIGQCLETFLGEQSSPGV